MVVKNSLKPEHFTRDLGDGTISHRLILPGPDRCAVKVTKFEPKAGFVAEDVVNPTDETVVVLRGMVWIMDLVTRKQSPVHPGETYHIPAGEHFGIQVDHDSVLICMFSAAPGGPLPDNE